MTSFRLRTTCRSLHVNGKLVRSLCREGHNIWVNQGRQYLAEVISPLNALFDTHYAEGSGIRVVKYMAVGIGGDSQAIDVAGTYPTLDTHYPGQQIFSDSDITVPYLERPVKVSGTAGVGPSAGVWLSTVTAPPTFSGSPITKVEFVTTFDTSDLHLSGAYPAVPLSEIGLLLSTETENRDSDEVYDYGSPPDYINASGRQKLIAYNTFSTITKTSSVSLEVHWEIQF